MTIKTWTVGIAVLALSATPAFAEQGLGYDSQVKGVAFACDSCCDGCDGCDGCDCGDGCGCGCGVGGAGLLSGMPVLGAIENFSFASILPGFADYGIDIGGWTQYGWTDEATLLTPIGGASFNDTPDSFNLHQQYFFVGREADGSNGFDLGFRADFVYGIDAPDTQSFGNPADGTFDFGGDFTRGDDNHGWAIPQLYGEVAVGDLSVIIGHFYTLVGYEVVTAPDNFFFSHALTQYNSEPFTHTGVLATYSGFENMTLYGGWTLGWDTGFDQTNSGNSFLGGFGVDLLDSVTLTYICTYGNFGAINLGDDDDYGHSVVIDVALTDNLNYIFQTDYKNVEDVAGGPRDEDIGINQYLIYSVNDWLGVGGRIEWWSDDTVSHHQATGGVNIKALDNLIFRPEFRHDWVPALDYNEDIVAMDMILTY